MTDEQRAALRAEIAERRAELTAARRELERMVRRHGELCRRPLGPEMRVFRRRIVHRLRDDIDAQARHVELMEMEMDDLLDALGRTGPRDTDDERTDEHGD